MDLTEASLTFILKVLIDLFDVNQIVEGEITQIVRLLVHIVGDHKRPIKPVMAEQLELLCIVVARQGFLAAFHV